MSKYKISLRRELSEISISVTDIKTEELIYKNGFFSTPDYKYTEEFATISNAFIQYANNAEVIELKNLQRYFDLLNNLLGDKALDINNIDINDKTNVVKIYGGIL